MSFLVYKRTTIDDMWLTEEPAMTDAAALLLGLQHADGQFPGGGFAFSWGLEGLSAEGRIDRRDLAVFIEGQLRHRWATFDRPIMAEAHRIGDDYGALADIDLLTDGWSLGAPQREGSCRAGGALLGFHARLGTAGALAYHERIRGGGAFGHLPVVQGLVWRGVGLPSFEAQAVSAYSLASGLAMGAVRLGLVGHVNAQEAITAARTVTIEILAGPVPSLGDLHSFTPLCEIAMLRHISLPVRLFAN